MQILDVIPIGNSKGIIIPSKFLKRLNSDKLEIIENDFDFTLKAVKSVREGWDLSAKMCHKNGDDKMMINLPNEFDEGDWVW